MTKDEALKKMDVALWRAHISNDHIQICYAIDAFYQLKKALAQLESTPVAFKYTNAHGKTVLVETSVKPYDDAVPLYEGPVSREWVGLMDAEIEAMTNIYSGMALYRRIEEKLRKKNT